MIAKKFYKTREDGVNLYRTYSDEQYKILQVETGEIYDEAIDEENVIFTYVETDEKVEILEMIEEMMEIIEEHITE